jgi:hypothetical protein
VYEHVPRSHIIEALRHFRELLRQAEPTNERERRAAEQREIVAKYLISNLPRTGEHPTLKSLLEVAETFPLTIGATHQLFGYDLDAVRQLDLRLNTSRTHIIESYIFDRDRLIDVPSELTSEAAFGMDAMLTDLVRKWQPPVPVRALDGELRSRTGAFYVHVGTEDSETTNLPPGSMALVDPVDQTEAMRPSPKLIYLLQFRNGYRCSRCVVSHGKLQMLTPPRKYVRAREFTCPGEARVAGRVRMFAHALPQPEYGLNDRFPTGRHLADLILPWEQRTRCELFSTEQRRFQRTREEERAMRERLISLLHAPLTGRTERRYRRPGLSNPHVSTLIQLTLLYFVRYSDSLRVSGSTISDHGRHSLDMMLNARRMDEISLQIDAPHLPKPETVWNARREFLEWVPLLSFKFPNLKLRQDPIARLSRRCELRGLEPALAAGSWLLLKPLQNLPNAERVEGGSGWAQPLYVLRRGFDLVTGHLERDSSGYALLSSTAGLLKRESVASDEISSLQQVVGVAVPV